MDPRTQKYQKTHRSVRENIHRKDDIELRELAREAKVIGTLEDEQDRPFKLQKVAIPENTIWMVENDCQVTTGTTPLGCSCAFEC